MGQGTAFLNCLLAPGNSFEKLHSLLEQLIALYIDEVCARQPMLRDENGLTAALDIGEQLGSLALERSD